MNTCRPLNTALLRIKTHRYHRWPLVKVMLSSTRRFLCSYSYVGCGSLLPTIAQGYINQTHKSLASNVRYNTRLLAQHRSNCTKQSNSKALLFTLLTISLIVPLVKLYYHVFRRSVRGVHVTSVNQHLTGEKFLTYHSTNSSPEFLMNSQLNAALLQYTLDTS